MSRSSKPRSSSLPADAASPRAYVGGFSVFAVLVAGILLAAWAIQDGPPPSSSGPAANRAALEITALRNDQPVEAEVRVVPEHNPEAATVAWTGDDGSASLTLDPGRAYQVRVADICGGAVQQPALRFDDIRPTAGETVRLTARFSAGTLAMILSGDGPVYNASARVFPRGSSSSVAEFAVVQRTTRSVRLLPGLYDIVVGTGWEGEGSRTQMFQAVRLRAGETLNVITDFPEGRLEVDAFRGSEAATARVLVSGHGSEAVVSRTGTFPNRSAVFRLQPGLYDIRVMDHWKSGAVETISAVSVRPDQTTSVEASFSEDASSPAVDAHPDAEGRTHDGHE